MVLFSAGALGETGTINVHLEAGPIVPLTGWQADELKVGVSGAGRFEWAVARWVGFELGGGYSQFFQGEHPAGYEPLDRAYIFFASAGLRFRLFNDEEGYLLAWKDRPDHAGNLWGNLWLDVHGNFMQTGDERPFGFDVGLGAELSIVDGIQAGPYARGTFIYRPDSINERDSEDAWLLTAGLSISLAIPFEGKSLPDTDGDGLYDPYDECPNDAEDFDGFEDEDGCPDEDNDEDLIPDISDACPMEPEDHDGFQDVDGCPEDDNDEDKIPDSSDRCPNEPEDYDNFEDSDGCPDVDNDKDKIEDLVDKCPDEAETKNGYQDDDGCPEPDRDQDGFPDDLDECPDEPETVNGIQDDDGCPDDGMVRVSQNRILLGKRIFFRTDMARIRTQSKQILEQLANLIKRHPEYVLISIEGHADERGGKKYNYKLSLRRADQVRRYLINLGVHKDRLAVKGWGKAHPWVEGDDQEAMAKNRRVELVIEQLDEDLAETPVAPETKNTAKGVEANPYGEN